MESSRNSELFFHLLISTMQDGMAMAVIHGWWVGSSIMMPCQTKGPRKPAPNAALLPSLQGETLLGCVPYP